MFMPSLGAKVAVIICGDIRRHWQYYSWFNVLVSLMFRYGSGTLTKVFVDRVFQECLTYDGEMVGCSYCMVYSIYTRHNLY
jgi:hypothetical protein